MTRLLALIGLAAVVAALVALLVAISERQDDVTAYREDDDGIQPTDPYLAAAARRDAMIAAGERSWTDA